MRYIILVLLNVPIIMLAFLNLLTRYKLRRMNLSRFRLQFALWSLVLIVLLTSFPVYNLATGAHPLESEGLSFFDIAQTTVIVLLFYIINNQRQKIDRADKNIRDLHSHLSILLSPKKRGKKSTSVSAPVKRPPKSGRSQSSSK
jgi:hypothetical protein